MPHLSVPDISAVNWPALQQVAEDLTPEPKSLCRDIATAPNAIQAGFKGVVFDKDNTLTLPFEMQARCRYSLQSAAWPQAHSLAGRAETLGVFSSVQAHVQGRRRCSVFKLGWPEAVRP